MLPEAATVVKMASYLGAAMSVGFGAIGAAIGEGYVAGWASASIGSRHEKAPDVIKNMLIGQAMAESTAIFALVVSMLLLFMKFNNSYITAMALISGGLCMGFGAIGSGVGSGFPAAKACEGMVRQPALTSTMTNTMILGAAVCQSQGIYSLVVAMMMLFLDYSPRAFNPNAFALLGAGFSTGLAAIGAGMGQGMIAGAALDSIARQPQCQARATATMLVSQAVTETPSIFGLVVSVLLIFRVLPADNSIVLAAAMLAAGICQGLGGIGPGLGNGITGQYALTWVGRSEETTGLLTRTMVIGQAVAQSTVIYAMVIALVLIFVI